MPNFAKILSELDVTLDNLALIQMKSFEKDLLDVGSNSYKFLQKLLKAHNVLNVSPNRRDKVISRKRIWM